MSIANILVAYNGTEAAKSAVRLAVLLAKRNDAHLTGLYAHSMPGYAAQAEPYMPPEVIARMAEAEAEAEARIEREFGEISDAEGMTARLNFLTVRGQPDDICAEFARTYDVMVIGQPEGDFWDQYREPHPDSVALKSGRAVLVAPRDFTADGFPGDVVLAWDGKRAAARALAEAMALSEGAERLLVLHIGEDDSAVRQPGRDVMEHLSRHGISAELRIEPRAGRSIGQTLTDTCEALGAGMLVMGAYEHSRFSEMILGGATRDVMANCKIPVLLAH